MFKEALREGASRRKIHERRGLVPGLGAERLPNQEAELATAKGPRAKEARLRWRAAA